VSESLLQLLRDEAVTLAETQLPGIEELRPLVGAVVKRLERLEQEVVGELKPAPAPAAKVEQPVYEQRGSAPPPPAPETSPAASDQGSGAAAQAPAPEAQAVATEGGVVTVTRSPSAAEVQGELDQAEADLAAAQARVAALKAQG